MEVISNKDADLLSQFGNFIEIDIPIVERLANLPPQKRSTPHQKMLIDDHTDPNKGKIKGCLYLEDFFGFCKTFKKVTKSLGFHVMFQTNDLKDIVYTSMDDDINATIYNLYLSIPNLTPSVETQMIFNEANQNNYKIFFDERYSERRVISDMNFQLDIGSTQQVICPKYLICSHQTKDRTNAPNKKLILLYSIISILEKIMLK